MTHTIRQLLQRELDTPIEEVVKVSQQEEDAVRNEIREYVLTPNIIDQYRKVLEPMAAFNEPTERVGVWVSGFFGSGKSSFVKNLGYVLANRPVMGQPAGHLFLSELEKQWPDDDKAARLATTLNFINHDLPMLVIMFDVQVEMPAGATAEQLARIMYVALLRQLDYCVVDFDVTELEIELEQEGRLAAFVRRCGELYGGQVEPIERPLPATLSGDPTLAEAYGVWLRVRDSMARAERIGRLLHDLYPTTWPADNSWLGGARRGPDVTIRLLVERTFDLAARRRPGHGVAYIMDEVGRYVAANADRIETLRAVVEHFGQESKSRVGRLRDRAKAPVWIVITSQERLDEIVDALDANRRIDLAKLQDRFPTRVDMHTSDIREVATKRVLIKTTPGAETLGRLYDQHGAALRTHTRLERSKRKQELNRADFIQFYPYLPHFIDLSIEIVTATRSRGDAPRHIGGSNRTIIKQAYEMLTNRATKLADRPVGDLVTIDLIYELISGNLSTETRTEIDAVVERAGRDSWPARVAKALALLGQVHDLPRSDANLAALLYGRLGDDSPLPHVTAALAWLGEAQFLGQDEHGWKLLTAAEKSWQTERNSYAPTSRERNEALTTQLKAIFDAPALSTFRHRDLRTFRVGAGWPVGTISGGPNQHLQLQLRPADGPERFDATVSETIAESKSDKGRQTLFWVFVRDDAIDDAVTQVARSANMLARYRQISHERKLADSEEAGRRDEEAEQARHEETLRGALRGALLAGRGVLDGVRRGATDFKGRTLDDAFRGFYGYAVEQLYPKLDMGLRAPRGKEAETVLRADNLNGLPPVFYDPPAGFGLVAARDGGQRVIDADAPLLKEILGYLEGQTSYGNKVTGKGLEEHFGGPPYGWEQDTLMLALATLLRGGAVEVTHAGRRHRNHHDPQVRQAFATATAFRATAFAPRARIGLGDLVAAARRYRDLTGRNVETEEPAIAAAIRKLATEEQQWLRQTQAVVAANTLPSGDALRDYAATLDQWLADDDDDLVRGLADPEAPFAAQRAAARRVAQGSDERGLARLRRFRRVVNELWPALRDEPTVSDDEATAVAALAAALDSDEFYARRPDLDETAGRLAAAYAQAYAAAHDARAAAYGDALAALRAAPEWADLPDAARAAAERPLANRDHAAARPDEATACAVCRAPLATLRADLSALPAARAQAFAQLRAAAAPPEATVQRLRLADVVGDSPSLNTADDVERLLAALRARLLPLVEAGTRVILE